MGDWRSLAIREPEVPCGQCLEVAVAITLAITVAVSGSGARQIAQAAAERYSDHCEDDSLDVAGIPVDEIQQLAQPTDKQRAALDELGNASVQAAQIVKASCPTELSLTAIGRIDAEQQRVQAMLKAVKAEQPALAKFYDMLTDEQKARLNTLTQKRQTPANAGSAVVTGASPVAGCRNRAIPDWPTAQSCATCILRRCSGHCSTHCRAPPRRRRASWPHPVPLKCRSPRRPGFQRSGSDCKECWKLSGPCAARSTTFMDR